MFATLWKFGLQVLPWTHYFTPTSLTAPSTTPADCFTYPTLVGLANCFEDFFTVPRNFYTWPTYLDAQPTPVQRDEWKALVKNLLSVNDINCATVFIPPVLAGIYEVRRFQDYCVLYETRSLGGTPKGWGFMVVPSLRSRIARHLHISAPHPLFDKDTVGQAAAIFQLTSSNSLLVAGRHRDAYLNVSDCIPPYSKTDPAHNVAEPFFDAIVKTYDWQDALDHCPPATCAFIQMHGKGNGTCSSDKVFLSSGLDTPPPPPPLNWYTDGSDRPVKRIKKNVKLAFPSWAVSLPSDSLCSLTATKNVAGRYINKVPIPDVCRLDATAANTAGKFVHIEQAIGARDSANYLLWSRAIANSF